MKTMNKEYHDTTLDTEIEQDVAELRDLLKRVPGPEEPHPAYWQNMVVRVRQRIDEPKKARFRWGPSVAWASITAAVLLVVGVSTGVIPFGAANTGEEIAGTVVAASNSEGSIPPIYKPMPEDDLLLDDPTISVPADNNQSIILSDDEVQMLNAILSDDNNAMFEALAEVGEI